MKKFKLTFLLLASIAVSSCSNMKTNDNSKSIKSESEQVVSNNDFGFTANMIGKYPRDIKLFENSNFTNRLQKLLGKNNYSYLIKNWNVETPIEIKDNVFVASSCQVHNCYSHSFVITIDLNKNIITVGVKKNGQVKTFAENSEDLNKDVSMQN